MQVAAQPPPFLSRVRIAAIAEIVGQALRAAPPAPLPSDLLQNQTVGVVQAFSGRARRSQQRQRLCVIDHGKRTDSNSLEPNAMVTGRLGLFQRHIRQPFSALVVSRKRISQRGFGESMASRLRLSMVITASGSLRRPNISRLTCCSAARSGWKVLLVRLRLPVRPRNCPRSAAAGQRRDDQGVNRHQNGGTHYRPACD